MKLISTLQRNSTRLVFGGLAFVVASVAIELAGLLDGGRIFGIVETAGLVLIGLGVLAAFIPGGDRTDEPRVIEAPVRGRWLAVNSPATKVPSHGTRAYGQSHAIDLVYDPEVARRPEFGAGHGLRPPEDYPAFGEPVFAPVYGTVVTARDGARDHRSRTRIWSLVYMFAEGAVREVGGAGRVVGNHVVIDAGDGCFCLIAHIQQGSAQVRVGDRVEAGQMLARCGNSGNSTEPHVHLQLMDRARPSGARGLPMIFGSVVVGDAVAAPGMPANHEYMTVRADVDSTHPA